MVRRLSPPHRAGPCREKVRRVIVRRHYPTKMFSENLCQPSESERYSWGTKSVLISGVSVCAHTGYSKTYQQTGLGTLRPATGPLSGPTCPGECPRVHARKSGCQRQCFMGHLQGLSGSGMGVRESVQRGCLRGPSVPSGSGVSKKSPKSVPRVSPECPKGSGDTPSNTPSNTPLFWAHSRGHSGDTSGPEGPQRLLSQAGGFATSEGTITRVLCNLTFAQKKRRALLGDRLLIFLCFKAEKPPTKNPVPNPISGLSLPYQGESGFFRKDLSFCTRLRKQRRQTGGWGWNNGPDRE